MAGWDLGWGPCLMTESVYDEVYRMPGGQLETLYLSQVQQAPAIKTAVE
jgi:hypothetical protein